MNTRYSVTGPINPPTGFGQTISQVLENLKPPEQFSTGGAYGVDTYAAIKAVDLWVTESTKFKIFFPAGEWYNRTIIDLCPSYFVAGGYMKRNDALIENCDMLLAFPRTSVEEQRSGTWATIRRARTAAKGIVITPLDGSSQWQEDWTC